MSTKKGEQKQDTRNSNITNPQEAKKDVEKIAEDAKKRKEAATIAKKLETIVEEKEGKKQIIVKALDESKDNIMKAIDETIAEIPRFAQNVQNFQEAAMESAREILDAFIESQRQVIRSLQSLRSLGEISGSIWNYWTFQPIITDLYLSTIRVTVDSAIAISTLAKKITLTNIEAAKTLMLQLKNNANELSSLSVTTLEQYSRNELNPD
jgi:chemotaxis protein histidine kinase CheA